MFTEMTETQNMQVRYGQKKIKCLPMQHSYREKHHVYNNDRLKVCMLDIDTKFNMCFHWRKVCVGVVIITIYLGNVPGTCVCK